MKMWFLIKIFVSYLLVSATTTALDKPIKGAIGFPEVEENPKFMNKENRTPVFLPSMCQENELYYPGDQKDDWICDCRPDLMQCQVHCIKCEEEDDCVRYIALSVRRKTTVSGYLYHPSTSTCWPAFRQGPCEHGHYLVLPRDSVIPTCYINPCMTDNMVIWNGKCEELGSMAPCGLTFPLKVLWVNVTNIVLDCVRVNMDENMLAVTKIPTPICPPGCKRSIENKCV